MSAEVQFTKLSSSSPSLDMLYSMLSPSTPLPRSSFTVIPQSTVVSEKSLLFFGIGSSKVTGVESILSVHSWLVTGPFPAVSEALHRTVLIPSLSRMFVLALTFRGPEPMPFSSTATSIFPFAQEEYCGLSGVFEESSIFVVSMPLPPRSLKVAPSST